MEEDSKFFLFPPSLAWVTFVSESCPFSTAVSFGSNGTRQLDLSQFARRLPITRHNMVVVSQDTPAETVLSAQNSVLFWIKPLEEKVRRKVKKSYPFGKNSLFSSQN